jgi:hypothetical protein
MNITGNNVCAVCGWRQLKLPQRAASGGASHEICPSCGFESGFTDDEKDYTYEAWRAKWVADGLKWFSSGISKPVQWNPMLELHALLKRKRPVIPTIRLARAQALRDNIAPPAAKKIARKTTKAATTKKTKIS